MIPTSRITTITLFLFIFPLSVEIKNTIQNRQCTSSLATGYHFTGPLALRHRLSSALPKYFFHYNTSHFPTSIFLCVKMKIIFQIHQTPDVYIYRFFRKESRPNPIVTMGLFIDGWHKSQNDPMRCVKKLPLLLMVRLQNFSISLLRFHKEEFISCSGFSILSMRYPIPMCVWIYCTPFFSGSSFFRSVAIKTLREATSFSAQRPQIC